jgi:hypothetical protein
MCDIQSKYSEVNTVESNTSSIFAGPPGRPISQDHVIALLLQTERGTEIVDRVKSQYPKEFHKKLADRVRTFRKDSKQFNSFIYFLVMHSSVMIIL